MWKNGKKKDDKKRKVKLCVSRERREKILREVGSMEVCVQVGGGRESNRGREVIEV